MASIESVLSANRELWKLRRYMEHYGMSKQRFAEIITGVDMEENRPLMYRISSVIQELSEWQHNRRRVNLDTGTLRRAQNVLDETEKEILGLRTLCQKQEDELTRRKDLSEASMRRAYRDKQVIDAAVHWHYAKAAAKAQGVPYEMLEAEANLQAVLQGYLLARAEQHERVRCDGYLLGFRCTGPKGHTGQHMTTTKEGDSTTIVKWETRK